MEHSYCPRFESHIASNHFRPTREASALSHNLLQSIEFAPSVRQDFSLPIVSTEEQLIPLYATAEEQLVPLHAAADEQLIPLHATADEQLIPQHATADEQLIPQHATRMWMLDLEHNMILLIS
ncbi:hypothetical protein ElyMa_005191000 [Elysia marginata]|uniref:Uncharacterized protein n=1 Tax=Elysia marginata TaxID=1093978 RepID=A0AAV4JSG0_9GAST|nr:hypothetical protein ElyMa_005191000 [Elysia marginata]